MQTGDAALKPFEMRIETSAENDHLQCHIKGYLDAHTVLQFEQELNEALDNSDQCQMLLDLADLYYISSAGIGALMGLTQKLRRQKGELVLFRPSEKVYNIFDLLGFTHIFKIVQTREEALAALN